MRAWDYRRSVSSVQILCSVGQSAGIDIGELLSHTGLDPALILRGSGVEVEASQELQVVRNLISCSVRGPYLGSEVGSRYRITSYGIWGYALMSSQTLRSALELGIRLSKLSFCFVSVEMSVGPDLTEMIIDDSEIPEAERQFLLERDIAAAFQLVNQIYSRPIQMHSVCFKAKSLKNFEDLVGLYGCAPELGASQNIVRFKNSLLDSPLPQADEATVADCVRLCMNMLEKRCQRTGLASKIRTRLLSTEDPFPSLEVIAKEMNMSPRSLRRHLVNEGGAFRDLLDETRVTVAEELLRNTQLSVEGVALRLGYSEASSFIAAFKRWKGITPRSFAHNCEVGKIT